MQKTKLNNKWLVKILIFTIFLNGLGAWGLYDAIKVYPARGQASADWSLREYLDAAAQSGDLLLAGVADPAGELVALEESEDELNIASSGQSTGLIAQQAKAKLKKMQWLRALAVIGRLDESFTRIDRPRERLDELTLAQADQAPPKPLSAFDIPMQWFFVVLGFGGAGWLEFLFLRVRGRKYQYKEDTLALTLPDGRTITPADIKELDKRKWDKFLVTIRLKKSADVRLDLLRYTPLEEWILEMEKQTDGYEPEPESETDADSELQSAVADTESEVDHAKTQTPDE